MTPSLAGIADVASWVLLSAGAFFYIVGMIGLIRMPDIFTRLHAISVGETLGVVLLIGGMILQAGFTLVAVKLVFTMLVLLASIPVISHALARAALHDGEKPLLADEENRLVPTNPVDLYPELADRLSEPLTSETVEGDEAAGSATEGRAAPSNS